jgi:hypothetical protein
VRKSQRRQNPPVHGKAHRYRTTNKPENNYEDEAAVERRHLEKAMELGLEELSGVSPYCCRSTRLGA